MTLTYRSWREVTMTYISRSSDFALYLEDFLIYEHHTSGLWVSMTRHFDLKIKVGHCDLYLMVQWFSLISWRLFDIWTSYFRIMSQYDLTFDLKINVGHCDLYFMVQWFCLISWSLFGIWTPYFGIMSQFLVWFLFYGPSTHFRSFQAWSVNLATLFLGKPPRQFTST